MFFKNNCLILAPMAGVTESVFRLLCKEKGADIVVTEMVSVDGIIRNIKPTLKLMFFEPSERPVGIQLFGSDPEKFRKSAAMVAERLKPDFIDLNAGCPVAKVVRKNGGSALLKDINRFEKILKAIIEVSGLPVTVKMRSGWSKFQWIDVEFARCAESCGAAAITLHPRSQTMLFSDHSFWERIAIVKSSVYIPVIGNGDVKNAADALAMKHQTGCDGIMIGRAAFGNPWIFKEIKAVFAGKTVDRPSHHEIKETVIRHISLFRERYGEHLAGREMKKHVCWYIRGMPGAAELRKRIFRAYDSRELEAIVKETFEKYTNNISRCI